MKKFCKKIQHIVEYILFLGLMKFLKSLGLDRAANLCSFIARKVGPLLGVSKIARRNLTRAFGSQIDIESTIDGLWDNFGRYIGEFPFINKLSSDEVNQRIKITGLEKIEKHIGKDKPFLMFLGHQANWDFVISIIDKIYPKFGVIYRRANNPHIDKEILHTRQKDNVVMIAKGTGGVKDLVRSIKSGSSIAMLVDQKMNDGIEVPFFDRPAMTANAIAKLSIQYNYPIVPCQIIRLGGSNFEVRLHPPLKYDETGDASKDSYNIMFKINQMLEEWIREKPEQWFWFHNRWKD